MPLSHLESLHPSDRLEKILGLLGKIKDQESEDVRTVVKLTTDLQKDLSVKEEQGRQTEKRVNAILEALLRYTVLDFSQPAEVGELGDDLDAISVGINTLAEELQEKIEVEVRNSEQLKEQNIKLERVNKELSSFAYVSSHDLQEPLRKINTYISRIRDEELSAVPSQVKFYLDRVEVSAVRMQKLIRDILEYSKLSNDAEALEKVDLTVLARETKEDYEEALKEAGANFAIEKLCEVQAIPFQVKRLFNNLVSNSIKFAATGKPLMISLKSNLETGGETKQKELLAGRNYCHLVYSDNGIGFEPQYNEKVFGVFQRLHDQSQYQGTGVGLAICKRIVENHGGTIMASGTLGEGVRFDIYWPV